MVVAANSYPNESTQTATIRVLSILATRLLVEVKNEADLGGDASLQAACRTRPLQHHLWTRLNHSMFFAFVIHFIDVDCRIHGSRRTIPPFFTVSWATFLKLE